MKRNGDILVIGAIGTLLAAVPVAWIILGCSL
jgi:hypothetical protein